MCRSTGFHGLQYGDRNRVTIKSFFVKLSGSLQHHNNKNTPLPESLTLLFLPRIDGSDITVSGSKIRPDSAAYVTLHRTVRGEEEAMFGSRERVRVGEGVRFEVYLREERVVEGMFRRDEEEEWRLECTCGLIDSGGYSAYVAAAEVCVGLEGHVALCERVEIVLRRGRKKSRRGNGCDRLELIPETRVEDYDDEGSDGYCCCNCEHGESGSDSGDSLEDEEELGCSEKAEMDLDLDLEGVRWAVDVGIWVLCLGVGFLVSRASAKNLRRLP